MEKMQEALSVAQQFQFEGKCIGLSLIDVGHINNTYKVECKTDSGINRYVLQRINDEVFLQPKLVMDNVEKVTEHLRKKIIAKGGNPDRETLNVVKTIDNKNLHINEKGSYWRSYLFIENSISYQVVEKPEHFYRAGAAFGEFQNMLSDFPADELHETIPDFHDTGKRFRDFIKVLEKDEFNLARNVKPEIGFILAREAETYKLVNMLKANELPLRVTHNDTKFNNIMLDADTEEAVCIVDLDTVMPGLSLYDFGDSIRFGTNTSAEDEVDLDKVYCDLELFEVFTKGYLESTAKSLTKNEIDLLPFSAFLISLELAMRFLTDYLSGDVYFRISRANHNLDRTRAQLKMAADIEDKFPEMMKIVNKYR